MLNNCLCKFRYGVVGNISVSHMLASGSIPDVGNFFFFFLYDSHWDYLNMLLNKSVSFFSFSFNSLRDKIHMSTLNNEIKYFQIKRGVIWKDGCWWKPGKQNDYDGTKQKVIPIHFHVDDTTPKKYGTVQLFSFSRISHIQLKEINMANTSNLWCIIRFCPQSLKNQRKKKG